MRESRSRAIASTRAFTKLWVAAAIFGVLIACSPPPPTPTPDSRLSCAEFRQEYNSMFGRLLELTRDQQDTLDAIFASVRRDAASAEDYSEETTALFAKMFDLLEAERDEVWGLAELDAPTERINARAVAFAQTHGRFLDANWEALGDLNNPTLMARMDALMEESITATERLDASIDQCQTQ